MLIKTLQKLFHRDLTRLQAEIELYEDSNAMWIIAEGISNSGGNLCLHLIGNLRTFIGATLGNRSYVRDRPSEFALKNVDRLELIRQIGDLKIEIAEVLGKLNENDLANEYPELVFAEKTSTEFFLVHLTTHLTYHLGQINYHRRLLDL